MANSRFVSKENKAIKGSSGGLTDFSLRRRTFLQVLVSGVVISVAKPSCKAQTGNGAGSMQVVARLYLNQDGSITALSGKVEEGQGSRAELSQAAAEELCVPVGRVNLIMADTELVPDDGITAGSRTTPRNVPPMRQAAATARELLQKISAAQWKVEPDTLLVRDGVISNPSNGETIAYSDLAKFGKTVKAFNENVNPDVTLTSEREWDVLARSIPRPNLKDLVTGRHRFPSDVVRPNMLYGQVLRPPAYESSLESIDLSAAESMKDVVVVREDSFVGFAAKSSFRAKEALNAVKNTAVWKSSPKTVSNRTLHSYLKENAQLDRTRTNKHGSIEQGLSEADKVLNETYTLPYIQHVPMEPRAAVAEWGDDGNLTVWAGCDGPFRARNDLANEFGISVDRVRVIIPDMGGGFGGKHSIEAGLEAARLARKAGRPVWIRWTREDEFTWAYFRPAAVIDCKAGVTTDNRITAWDFSNINAGSSGIDSPYSISNVIASSISSDSPLRQGAYRCLAATGNNFARESFMDELAAASGIDPLDFRLAHLENPRIRKVLIEATEGFGWKRRISKVSPELGIGLACGTEKNSVVATCVEVRVDRTKGEIKVVEVYEAFECGPILNPANLESQVHGCIIMGMGGALSEEIQFDKGIISNPSFRKYKVPRFKDVPKISVKLVNNSDIPSAGGGETPIIAVAPAIGNAVFSAIGVRLRSLPMRV